MEGRMGWKTNRSSARDDVQFTSVDIPHTWWREPWNVWRSCQCCLNFLARNGESALVFRLFFHLTLDRDARGSAFCCCITILLKSSTGWTLIRKENSSLHQSLVPLLISSVCMSFSPSSQSLSSVCLPVSSFLPASHSFWPPHPCRIYANSNKRSEHTVLCLSRSLSIWLFFSVNAALCCIVSVVWNVPIS